MTEIVQKWSAAIGSLKSITGTVLLAIPLVALADSGEIISPPVAYATYVLVPGKLTGEDFLIKTENLDCKIFCFDQFHTFPKPAATVNLPFSMRGGYPAHAIFGHDDFSLDEGKNVAIGWVPQCNGNFVIFPDNSKQHLPQWVPERTRLIRVPFIQKSGDTVVNAYDLALGLDRFNTSDAKSQSVEFKIVPITDDNGKAGKRLVPASPLADGVYYAYSLPDDKDTENNGFLFAVGNPASAVGTQNSKGTAPPTAANEVQPVDAKLAASVLDYALLSQAIYDVGTSKFNGPNGWEAVDPVTFSSLLDPKKAFYNDPVNDFTIGVFIKGKNLAVVFRGTTGFFLFSKDWRTDIAAKMGMEPGQYKDALIWVDNIIQRDKNLSNFKVVLTGHSLGGGLATYAALHYFNQPAVVFNAEPMGPGMLNDIQNLDEKKKLIENIDMAGDIVSGIGGQVGPIYIIDVPPGVRAQLGAEWQAVQDAKHGLTFISNLQEIGAGSALTFDSIMQLHSMDNIILALQLIPGIPAKN